MPDDAWVKTISRPRPRFAREMETPKLNLPVGKKLGSVLVVTVAKNHDIFILHQPNPQGVVLSDDPLSVFLPPLVHLDPKGNFIAAWGGEDHIPKVNGMSQWPAGVEGLECDDDGNIWIFGYKQQDDAVLKFSPDGKLLLRIGERGKQGNDEDTKYLAGPTTCYHDTKNREVFVSDGYRNHRIIAFNSDTGEFTRLWGAYGKKPSELTEEQSFSVFAVHKVACGPNGLLYVADRAKSRIQEFERIPGGARFTREIIVAPGTRAMNTGSCWDINFSPDGKFMYVADGPSFRVWSVALDTFEVLGSTTVFDEYENDANLPIHFGLLHRFTVEPNGDLLLACVNRGLRRLKFIGIR